MAAPPVIHPNSAADAAAHPNGVTIAADQLANIYFVEALQKIAEAVQKIAEAKELEAGQKIAEAKELEAVQKIETKEIEEVQKKNFKGGLPGCYLEIKKLLAIERDPTCAKALEEWTRKEAQFSDRLERKRRSVAELKNEVYQLIGFFSVFQGVLLTAVANASLLQCNNWWSPIVLSIIASAVAVAGVVQKLIQIDEFQKTIHTEVHSLKEVKSRLTALRSEGPERFKFAKFADDKSLPTRSRSHFWFLFALVIGSLLVFSLAFPISYWRILCYSGVDS